MLARRKSMTDRPDGLRTCACLQPLFQERALGFVACQREGRGEVKTRSAVVATAQLQFAERRRVERVTTKALAILNQSEFLEATVRAITLSDGDRAIERDDRRWCGTRKVIVKLDDERPIRSVDV